MLNSFKPTPHLAMSGTVSLLLAKMTVLDLVPAGIKNTSTKYAGQFALKIHLFISTKRPIIFTLRKVFALK